MAPDEDPYMESGDANDEDSDTDDWAFKANDLVIPATKAEEEIYSLELWVYEEADDDDAGNLYVQILCRPAQILSFCLYNSCISACINSVPMHAIPSATTAIMPRHL